MELAWERDAIVLLGRFRFRSRNDPGELDFPRGTRNGSERSRECRFVYSHGEESLTPSVLRAAAGFFPVLWGDLIFRIRPHQAITRSSSSRRFRSLVSTIYVHLFICVRDSGTDTSSFRRQSARRCGDCSTHRSSAREIRNKIGDEYSSSVVCVFVCTSVVGGARSRNSLTEAGGKRVCGALQ